MKHRYVAGQRGALVDANGGRVGVGHAESSDGRGAAASECSGNERRTGRTEGGEADRDGEAAAASPEPLAARRLHCTRSHSGTKGDQRSQGIRSDSSGARTHSGHKGDSREKKMTQENSMRDRDETRAGLFLSYSFSLGFVRLQSDIGQREE